MNFVDNVINFSGLFLSGLTGIKLNLVEDLPDKVMFLKKGSSQLTSTN